MRATFVTTALENGAQLEDVQKAAGHRDPNTTKLYDRRAIIRKRLQAFCNILITKVISMVKLSFPNSIYRYRSLVGLRVIKRELDNIKNKTVFGSVFSSMNDPMEGFFLAQGNTFKDDLSNSILNNIVSSKTSRRICAFSESFEDELMWAHYAGQSYGICIKYDFDKLLNSIDSVKSRLIKVVYTDIPITAPDGNVDIVSSILGQKSLAWKGEKEWRIIETFSDGMDNRGRPINIGDSVSAVYIGCRVTDEHQRRIKRNFVTIYPKCAFFRMVVDGYRLNFSEVS